MIVINSYSQFPCHWRLEALSLNLAENDGWLDLVDMVKTGMVWLVNYSEIAVNGHVRTS